MFRNRLILAILALIALVAGLWCLSAKDPRYSSGYMVQWQIEFDVYVNGTPAPVDVQISLKAVSILNYPVAMSWTVTQSRPVQATDDLRLSGQPVAADALPAVTMLRFEDDLKENEFFEEIRSTFALGQGQQVLWRNVKLLVASVMLFFIATAMIHRMWKLGRWQPNACQNCGYLLKGIPDRVCPECGVRSEPRDVKGAQRNSTEYEPWKERSC
ncbi:MAG TPA: hypothetical protein VK176_01310 [Phycisphaerales bacterium]|nr:hypothetical protein [Phycisphaerales bacterium]